MLSHGLVKRCFVRADPAFQVHRQVFKPRNNIKRVSVLHPMFVPLVAVINPQSAFVSRVHHIKIHIDALGGCGVCVRPPDIPTKIDVHPGAVCRPVHCEGVLAARRHKGDVFNIYGDVAPRARTAGTLGLTKPLTKLVVTEVNALVLPMVRTIPLAPDKPGVGSWGWARRSHVTESRLEV